MIEMKKLSVNLTPNDIVRNDDTEKYLFSNNKTIGFRKDKKLYKFVGLRDGDDKQFELSFKSIKIDDSEKISANRQYFTGLSENGKITHNINDVEITSAINETQFQNFVKVDEAFTDVEIVYEVHLLNLNYVKSGNKINIQDDSGDTIFVIDKPIVKAESGDILDIVEHEIYEEDDKIYYKKYINNNTIVDGFPLYIDINVVYNVSSYGLMRSSNTIPSTVPRSIRWKSALDGENTITKVPSNDILTYNLPSSVDNCSVDRYFTLFNTSSIGQYDEIITAELTIEVTGYNDKLVIHQGTADDYNSVGWTTFTDDVLLNGLIIETAGTYKLDVRNAINKSNYTSFFIRMYELDYLGGTPAFDDSSSSFDNLSFTLDIYYKEISNTKTFKFDLIENGTGVLSSSAFDYSDCVNGSDVTIVNSSITSDVEGIVYEKIDATSGYTINRTYLCFDTRQLSPYLTDNVDSVTMRLVMPNTDIFSLTLTEGTQSGDAPLGTYNWNDRGREITEIALTPPDDDLIVSMNRSAVNFDDYTTFVIMSTVHDYNGQESGGAVGDVYVSTEFSMGEIYLEIDIESHKVYGQTYKKVEYNTDFTLTTYSNTSSGIVKWFDDSSLTNEIGSGYSITLNSKTLYDADIKYIYSILEDDANNQISNNVLDVSLGIFEYEYDSLPQKSNNVVPMSLDNIYFKNYSCLNGVCFVYARIVEEVYEENIYVSDGTGIGSYNLYSEYDSIDEFYTNIYEVDVAVDTNIDITKLYNSLDGVTLVKGSRLLLLQQTNLEENGIYIVANNGSMTRTDELLTEESAFRAKINVKAGTYLDAEFHTFE